MLPCNLSLQLLKRLEEVIIRLLFKEFLFTLVNQPEIKIKLIRKGRAGW